MNVIIDCVDVKGTNQLFTIVQSILMTSLPVDACPACASPRRVNAIWYGEGTHGSRSVSYTHLTLPTKRIV